MRIYLSLFVLLGVLAGGTVFAQEQGEVAEAAAQAESVTLADLEVEDAGILPTSPFYFFKEWGRGVQSFFTFNSVGKAELEVKFANEKAAELKVVQEQESENRAGVARALENYTKAQERLRVRFEGLRQTSENPNVDKLLDRLAERSVKHAKLLEELEGRFEASTEVQEEFEKAKTTLSSVLAKAAEQDTPEKLKARFKLVLEQAEGGEFKDARSAEIIERFAQGMPEEAKERMNELRFEFAEKFAERVEEAADRGVSAEELRGILSAIPGDKGERAALLQELQFRASDRFAGHFERAAEHFDQAVGQSERIQAKAAEQIEEATEELAELQEEMAERQEVSQAVTRLAQEVEARLAAAREAFEAEQYGQAFGLATAAKALAKNAERILEFQEEAQEEVREFEEEARERKAEFDAKRRELEARLQERVSEERGDFTERVEKLRREAEERKLEFLEESEQKSDFDQNTDRPASDVVCTQEFKPVCGADGNTYSNRCVAEKQNRVRIAYEGDCKVDRDDDSSLQRDATDILKRLVPPRISPDLLKDAQ